MSPEPRSHLSSALRKYSDRDQPDYRNSIKEAISAIEALLSVVNGKRSSNMPTAVSDYEARNGKLHPAFRNALLQLYGWTSDESGIRHSLITSEANVGDAHARFMIVTCSAFVNFLIAAQSDQPTKA